MKLNNKDLKKDFFFCYLTNTFQKKNKLGKSNSFSVETLYHKKQLLMIISTIFQAEINLFVMKLFLMFNKSLVENKS